MVWSLLSSCGAGSDSTHYATDGDTLTMRYAVNLTMVDYDGYTVASVRNPWDTTRTLQTYILVDHSRPQPKGLPNGTVVKVPLSRSVVYTSVHNALISELGALDAVAGIADAQYIYKPEVRRALDDGRIVDCGKSMAPNLEQIMMLNPDAILLSAFENSNDHNKVDQMGVPIIDCAEYMETSPLGQAEWVRFYGRLYGKGAEADSLFEATVKAYNGLKARMADISQRPKVMTDLIYGDSWSVPGALSTYGVLISDAGGHNAFDCYQRSGAVRLSPEEVLYRGADADIWLVRYDQTQPLTLSQLGQDNNIYTQFVPYSRGEVYGCNTHYSSYYEDVPFHPDWILAHLVSILHPEAGIEDNHPYYTKLQP